MKYLLAVLGAAWAIIFFTLALFSFADDEGSTAVLLVLASAVGVLIMLPYLRSDNQNAFPDDSQWGLRYPETTLKIINECMRVVKESKNLETIEEHRKLGLQEARNLRAREANGYYSDTPSAAYFINFFQNEAFVYIDELNTPSHFDLMGGHEFERYCAKLLISNGFINVEITSRSGDFGVDVLAEKDGITFAIQCKRQSSNVSNKAVQEVFSGKEFYKRKKGVVLTNQYFTKSAKETAKRIGIILWDRDKLKEMSNTKLPEDSATSETKSMQEATTPGDDKTDTYKAFISVLSRIREKRGYEALVAVLARIRDKKLETEASTPTTTVSADEKRDFPEAVRKKVSREEYSQYVWDNWDSFPVDYKGDKFDPNADTHLPCANCGNYSYYRAMIFDICPLCVVKMPMFWLEISFKRSMSKNFEVVMAFANRIQSVGDMDNEYMLIFDSVAQYSKVIIPVAELIRLTSGLKSFAVTLNGVRLSSSQIKALNEAILL